MFGIKDSENFVKLIIALVKTPAGMLALFALLVVFGFGEYASNMENGPAKTAFLLFDRLTLIAIMLVFVWLFDKHREKLFEIRQLFNKIAPSKLTNATAPKEAKAKCSILWVDDKPENNLYEKQIFEREGIKVDVALTTNEALPLIKDGKYSAIISDIKRKEGDQEGYVLLNKLRESKNQTPFFIYANATEPEQKTMAKSKGAQGLTNQAQELYQMVMKTAQ